MGTRVSCCASCAYCAYGRAAHVSSVLCACVDRWCDVCAYELRGPARRPRGREEVVKEKDTVGASLSRAQSPAPSSIEGGTIRQTSARRTKPLAHSPTPLLGTSKLTQAMASAVLVFKRRVKSS